MIIQLKWLKSTILDIGIRHRVKPRGPMIDSNYKVLTIGGWMNIEKGQWILTNDEGDHLVVDDDYFHEVYERVE